MWLYKSVDFYATPCNAGSILLGQKYLQGKFFFELFIKIDPAGL